MFFKNFPKIFEKTFQHILRELVANDNRKLILSNLFLKAAMKRWEQELTFWNNTPWLLSNVTRLEQVNFKAKK